MFLDGRIDRMLQHEKYETGEIGQRQDNQNIGNQQAGQFAARDPPHRNSQPVSAAHQGHQPENVGNFRSRVHLEIGNQMQVGNRDQEEEEISPDEPHLFRTQVQPVKKVDQKNDTDPKLYFHVRLIVKLLRIVENFERQRSDHQHAAQQHQHVQQIADRFLDAGADRRFRKGGRIAPRRPRRNGNRIIHNDCVIG